MMTTAFLRLISLGLSLQGISGFSASVVRSGNSRISSCSAQESSARSSLSVSPFSTAASSIRKFRSHSTSCTRRYVAPDTESTRKSRENVSVQSEGGLGSVALSSTKNGDSITQEEDVKGALKRTLLWVGLAAVFGTGLFFAVSPQVSEEFFAGYLLEQSLSVDNLLVFLLLFEYFQVPKAYQNRVLNWGIFGAIVMRATMIGAGAIALQQFHAVLLVFAGILIYSSAKVLLGGEEEEEEDFSENMVVQFSNKFIQSTSQFDGDRFFTEVDGVRLATPMFLCMVAVELSDVVFAVDSIPAVFGVTENPLVVFSSNMFAIMGLRSLYTILSKAASELKYVEPAVAVILGFIGVKLVAEYFGTCIPTDISLGVVASLLGGGVAASLLDKDDDEAVDAE